MMVPHIAEKTFDNNEMFIGGIGGMLKKFVGEEDCYLVYLVCLVCLVERN